MNRKLITSALLFMALFNLSFRWPLTDSILTATYGESRSDHFHDGIDMISNNPAVYPVSPGKLLFTWNKTFFPLDNYWGGGNYKIISHENSLVSVYMHLEDGDALNQEYKDSDIIGYFGNTGHSYGRHIHFSILDLAKKESLNPFLNLPPYQDTKAPDILQFHIRIGDKYTTLRDNSNIRLTQHYPLLVEIRDTMTGKENLGIYRLKAVVNNEEILNTDFSRIGINEKGLTIQKFEFDDIFDPKGYYKISGIRYKDGLNIIQIIASDYNGNTTEKNFTLNIKLDM